MVKPRTTLLLLTDEEKVKRARWCFPFFRVAGFSYSSSSHLRCFIFILHQPSGKKTRYFPFRFPGMKGKRRKKWRVSKEKKENTREWKWNERSKKNDNWFLTICVLGVEKGIVSLVSYFTRIISLVISIFINGFLATGKSKKETFVRIYKRIQSQKRNLSMDLFIKFWY